jgi:hypothetical protein
VVPPSRTASLVRIRLVVPNWTSSLVRRRRSQSQLWRETWTHPTATCVIGWRCPWTLLPKVCGRARGRAYLLSTLSVLRQIRALYMLSKFCSIRLPHEASSSLWMGTRGA